MVTTCSQNLSKKLKSQKSSYGSINTTSKQLMIDAIIYAGNPFPKPKIDYRNDATITSQAHSNTSQSNKIVAHELFDFENRQFSYNDLRKITNNFRSNIGTGGFGSVYVGVLENGTQVAVKMRSHTSSQGVKEFLAEVINPLFHFITCSELF